MIPPATRSASDALRSRLAEGPPLLLDAALGTELERRGAAGPPPLWSAEALLRDPGAVSALHEAEVAAGAEILTANTFRTHRRTLAKAGRERDARFWTQRAIALAREAARGAARPVFVVGSLSPLEDCYRPELVPDDAALRAEHGAQADELARAGADAILVETQNTVRELAAAARAAKATGLPVIASIVTDGAKRLLSGEPIAAAVDALSKISPDALAINCVPARALAHDLGALEYAAPGAVIGAYGNVGHPGPDGSAEQVSPEEYAALAREWLRAGARLVGGCCGTTSEHTAALRSMLDAWVGDR